MKPAGFWIRLVAATVDGFVLWIADLPMMFGLRGWLIGDIRPPENPTLDYFTSGPMVTYMVACVLVGVMVRSLYYGLFYRSKGASPGKMLLGLKVVLVGKDEYPSFGQTALREIVGKMFCSNMTFGIGYIVAGFRSDKRALHDLIAGTHVVHGQAAS